MKIDCFIERYELIVIEFYSDNLFWEKVRSKAVLLFLCVALCLFLQAMGGASFAEEQVSNSDSNVSGDLATEENAAAISRTDQQEDNWDNSKKEPASGAAEQLSAVPVVDSTGLDKAMDQALRESMITQARAYYPMIREMSSESGDTRMMFEIIYDAASEKDMIALTHQVNKEQMTAQVQVLSPLLQKIEDMKMEGDARFVEAIQFSANSSLTAAMVGPDAKIVFVEKMEFKLLRPVQMSVKQLPGLIRIEFRFYSPEAAEPESSAFSAAVDRDILFQAPSAPQTTAQVFGQSFQNERDYEREVNFGGEVTLLDQLESAPLASRPRVNSDVRGASYEAVREDNQFRYPRFGSIEYWKKHLSGVVKNTTKLLKQRRGQQGLVIEEPEMAVVYDRPGPAHIRLGYNFQRQYPFFYQRLGRLAPADGIVRQDIQGGVVFTSQSPWIFSFQNKLSIFSHENLSASSKFGDRLHQYRYEAGHATRYNLKRGFLQVGVGMKFETQEVEVRNRDIESYLSLLWYRPFSKKLAGQAEYNQTHRFIREGEPQIDMNVHRLKLGLDYKLRNNIVLKPSLGLAFYDGEAFYGVIGGLHYIHRLSRRDKVTLSYDTDFVRDEVSTFGQESLNTRRISAESFGDLIRYQVIRAIYERRLSKKLTLQIGGSYRRESELAVKLKDKYGEYRFFAALNRRLSKQLDLELRYTLSYFDAYKVSENALGGVTKSDRGNTSHDALFRVFYRFGQS